MDLQTQTKRSFLSLYTSKIHFTIKKHSYILSLIIFIIIIIIIITISSIKNPNNFHYNIDFPSSKNHEKQGCDYSNGEWVWDENYPFHGYNESCKFLDPGFRCHENGRVNQSFRQWRWQPHGCDLPRFNASDFLERIRNGRIVFAGDSIGRNQWESLLCMLSKGVSNQSSIYEVNGVPISKHKTYLSILFQEFNVSIEYYRLPFLVVVARPPPNSPTQVRGVIKIDELHWWSRKWPGAHVYVFNNGHWWNHAKTIASGLYFEEKGVVNMTMDYTEAFRRSMRTLKTWAEQHLNPQRSRIVLRSYSSVHYRNGTWDTGGTCRDNQAPKTSRKRVQADPLLNQYTLDVVKEMEADKMKEFLTRGTSFFTLGYWKKILGPRETKVQFSNVGVKFNLIPWHSPRGLDHWYLSASLSLAASADLAYLIHLGAVCAGIRNKDSEKRTMVSTYLSMAASIDSKGLFGTRF